MKQDEEIDRFESEVKKTYRRESDQEQIDAWVQEFKGAMEQRFALTWRHDEDLPVAEMSRRLGRSASAVARVRDAAPVR